MGRISKILSTPVSQKSPPIAWPRNRPNTLLHRAIRQGGVLGRELPHAMIMFSAPDSYSKTTMPSPFASTVSGDMEEKVDNGAW